MGTVGQGGSECVERTTWLYKKESDLMTYWVGFEIKPDALVITDFEMGEILKKTWHDDDLEHYVIIKREHIADFLTAVCAQKSLDFATSDLTDGVISDIMHAAFKGQDKMIFQVQDVLKAEEIPYDFQVW